jgi:hypothetical protein
MNAIIKFPKQDLRPFDMLESFPLPVSLEEILFEQAVDKFVTTEAIASWMESADNVREQSKYFGQISNEELFGVVFGRFSNGEQREQAAILLHMRFVSEHMEEIQQVVAENKEYHT